MSTAALDVADVQMVAKFHDGSAIGDAATAWLNAYHAGLALGFGEIIAWRQAAFAWDLSASAPYVLTPAEWEGCRAE